MTQGIWAVFKQTAHGWAVVSKGHNFQGACTEYDKRRDAEPDAVFTINTYLGAV